jgi:hypothetical protein
MVRLAEHELETAQAEDEPSLMALHYAVKTLAGTIRRSTEEPFDTDEARRLVAEVREFLDGKGSDNDLKIRRTVSEIRGLLGSIQPAG